MALERANRGPVQSTRSIWVYSVSEATLFEQLIVIKQIMSFKGVFMEKHYDVGVIGWWHNSNYGSMLTYYALHQTLKKLGYSVLMIHEALGYETGRVKWNYDNAPHRFAKAHYDFAEQVHYNELPQYNDICDSFVVGSDQLWNPHIDRVNSDCFLDFTADDKRRISYGTSFGNVGVLESRPNFVKKNYDKLRRFDAVSVREDYAVNAAMDNFKVKAVRVADPVFLPDISEYLTLAEQAENKINGEYLLAFILDPTEEKKNVVAKLADKLGYKKIFVLTDPFESAITKAEQIFTEPNMEMFKLEQISPENFLCAYKNAAYVVTDSFHGTCFSYIFRKNFNVFYNILRGADRFVCIVGLMGLENRRIYEDGHTEPDTTPIDYSAAEANINQLRDYSLNWLRKSLETPKENLPSIVYHENVSIILDKKKCNGCSVCSLVCPTKAITIQENGEGFLTPVIDNSKCVYCGLCVKKCVSESKKNVTTELDKTFCMGCGACVSICPVNALLLQADALGYYRSTVDNDKCVQCGKCTKICPAIKLPEKTNSPKPDLYEFIVKDEKILFDSSSGGAFPMLAAEVFDKSGVAVGAAWRDDFSVEHIMIDKPEDLHKLQKSKYLQSYTGDIFRKVREKLEQNIFVLFTGCPCQIAGLKAFLEKDYENLITVDLLCGNAPSTMFFQKYMNEEFPEGLRKYEFRHKAEGWNPDCIITTTTTGVVSVRRSGKRDNYQRVYHNHTMCPPHCEKCEYQAVPRFGDLTIGDFWWLNDKDKTVDISKGVSAVLCNNQKGKEFFESIPEEKLVVRKQVPLEWLRGNGYAINGAHNWCSPNRNDFYKAIRKMSFKESVIYAMKPDHGVQHKRGLFDFSSKGSHFSFNPTVWEENYINGIVVLSTKETHPKVGNYAVMPIHCMIKAGESYVLKMRFKISTDSNEYNFHLKSAGESFHQIIYSHKVSPADSGKWVEITHNFKADSDIYDEFMIGAAQLTGENRWIAIDYIVIDEICVPEQHEMPGFLLT